MGFEVFLVDCTRRLLQFLKLVHTFGYIEILVLLVDFEPFSEFVSSHNQRVQFVLLLLQYLEAVRNIVIHDVEQNIVWICVQEPLGN